MPGSRASSSSRHSGGSPASGPIGQLGPIDFGYDVGQGAGSYGVGIGTNEDGDREITGQGGIGFDVGGNNGSINPAGASPFSPTNSGARSPSSGGIDLGKGGRGIDLGKDAAPDLGKKSPGRSPIGIEIGASPAGNLGIGVSVPIGASPFQARGINIDPQTGEVSGGSVGLGVGIGPIGANVDVGVDEGGCIQYVTVGFGPFSRTFQKNVCSPNEPPKQPSPSPSPSPQGIGYTYPNMPPLDPNCIYLFRVLIQQYTIEKYNFLGWGGPGGGTEMWERTVLTPGKGTTYIISSDQSGAYKIGGGEPIRQSSIYLRDESYQIGGNFCSPAQFESIMSGYYLRYFSDCKFNIAIHLVSCSFPKPWQEVPYPARLIEGPTPSPLPNTPPRKNNMDDACCKYLAALIIAYGKNQSNLLGQPINELAEPIGKPIFPLEIKRIATPKDPKNPYRTEKIAFNNFYELINYLLNQSINLDVALDPQGIDLISSGSKMMNPLYERPSDYTLKFNKEPSQDKAGNDRELKVGEKIFFPSMLAEQRYIFESIRRLEYLFPAGELADAQISKNLLMPGQKGELKIFNLIHAYEILLQYLSAILGDPREPIILKDVNPAKPGDQGVNISHMSISHLIREMFKFTLDTEGDVDALMMMGLRDFRTNLANRIQLVQIAEMVTALFEDSGMLEKQTYIKIPLEGDPYAGQWKPGKGFDPDPKMDEDTEEATEAILQATLNNFEAKIKVSRRDNKEKADIRDLLVQLSKFIERRGSIPATEEGIQKAIESAQFKVKTDMALIRQQVKAAATTSRPRTRRKKKK